LLDHWSRGGRLFERSPTSGSVAPAACHAGPARFPPPVPGSRLGSVAKGSVPAAWSPPSPRANTGNLRQGSSLHRGLPPGHNRPEEARSGHASTCQPQPVCARLSQLQTYQCDHRSSVKIARLRLFSVMLEASRGCEAFVFLAFYPSYIGVLASATGPKAFLNGFDRIGQNSSSPQHLLPGPASQPSNHAKASLERVESVGMRQVPICA
jgi:hypothetical protein